MKESLQINEPLQASDNIFDLGATSLTMINLLQAVRERFNLNLPVEGFMSNASLGELEVWIQELVPMIEPQIQDSIQPVVMVPSAQLPPLSQEKLGQLLAKQLAIKVTVLQGERCYAYASAGGINPNQAYLAVGDKAVDDLAAGHYYYDPEAHSLCQIESTPAGSLLRVQQVKGIVLYLLGVRAAIAPIYLNTAGFLSVLDAGYMTEVLQRAAIQAQLQLQSIQQVPKAAVVAAFDLTEEVIFTAALQVGTVDTQLSEVPLNKNMEPLALLQVADLTKVEVSAMTSDELVELKARRLHLRQFASETTRISMAGKDLSTACYVGRSCKRTYAPHNTLQLTFVERLLSEAIDEASFPVEAVLPDVLVYCKPETIMGTVGGYYRYVQGRLELLYEMSEDPLVRYHTPFNRKHYKASAFSIFLLASITEASADTAQFHASVHLAGQVGQRLLDAQKGAGLGLCPVGGFYFDIEAKRLQLPKGMLMLHSFVGGAYEYEQTQAVVAPVTRPVNNKEIAIIGMSIRFPHAETLEDFWQLLSEGRDAITPVPIERWKSDTQGGGFLQHIDRFDASHFGMNAIEADHTDPQVRLLLEEAWKALENAGYPPLAPGADARQHVGVFVGSMYLHYNLLALDEQTKAELSLMSYSSLAHQLSYFFNFEGPSKAIDTACASAMVAIHDACESIRKGECSMALAGAANLSLHPDKYTALEHLGLISTDQTTSRSFGDGDGFVPGEGIGMIVLKPLSRAVADRDHIYGVIKGSSISHNGRTSLYSSPSTKGYQKVMEKALQSAQVPAESIGYLEAAANGTPLTDAMEIDALKAVYGIKAKIPVPVGSVKSNLGHLEAASGLSQLAKVLLQLQHGQIAPSLHHEPRNPLINLDNSGLQLVNALTDWPASNTPRRAAIGSYAAGGTNAHLIVEEYMPKPDMEGEMNQPALILLSAPTERQLQSYLNRLLRYLEQRENTCSIHDIAYTLANGREYYANRIALVYASTQELVAQLRTWEQKEKLSTDVQWRGEVTQQQVYSFTQTADFRQLMQKRLLKADFTDLATMWTGGFVMNWRELFAELPGHRLPLPTMVFNHCSHWITPLQEANKATEAPATTRTAVTHVAPLNDVTTSQHPEIDPTVRSMLADLLQVNAETIEPNLDLALMGVDSLMLIKLMNRLSNHFEVKLKPGQFVRSKNLQELSTLVQTVQHQQVVPA